MFRKIVTELIYSPALAGRLGDFIKQMREERSKRQIGLIFITLAIVVQLFATLFPPESANAINPDVFIDGGVQSIDDYLSYYDQNTGNIRDLLASLGISRTAIEASQLSTTPQANTAATWSLINSRTQDTSVHFFQTTGGALGTAYYRPTAATLQSFVGASEQSGDWFAIETDTGRLITEKTPTTLCAPLAGSGDTLIAHSWSHNNPCKDTLSQSLSVRAITTSSSHALDIVRPSDRIAYTISVTNESAADASIMTVISLEDILEYARILDTGSGEYDYDTKTLSWPTTTVAAHDSIERNFIIQLLPTIPSTARGAYVTRSYDCIIEASFGSSTALPVDCPPAKYIERITSALPDLSATQNLIAAAGLLIGASYLYIRSRQILTELYIIRHTHIGGI